MTSRRRLKKEIDYVVSDLILDCFTYTSLYEKSNDDAALLIVQDTLNLRNDLRNKANHPEQKETSVSIKSYYDDIAKALLEGVDAGYGKLGKMVNAEE